MAKSTFHAYPIEPSGSGVVKDNAPVKLGGDSVDAGLQDADKRELDLSEARKALGGLKGAAFEIPTLSNLIQPLSDHVDRADGLHLEADDADRAVVAARRTRDVHEAAALRVPGGDPVATAANAQKALDEALARAENANRVANTSVMIALNDARNARKRIRGGYRDNADRLTRERLRAYEAERTAAIEAAQEAQRRIHRAVSAFGAVRGMAVQLPEDDRLRELVSKTRFDPSATRTGTNQPNLDAVLSHLGTVPSRLGYGADNPHRAYPVVGEHFGEAVRIASDNDD